MMKKIEFRFTIFQKLWLGMILASIVPLVAVWYVTRVEILHGVNRSIAQELGAAARRLSVSSSQWIDMNRRAMRENAGLVGMQSMDPLRQDPILKQMHAAYDWTNLAYTIAANGQNVGRSDGEKTKYYGNRTYFKAVMSGRPFVHEVVIGKTTHRPTLILARPIHDSAGQIVGVLGMGMPLDDLSRQILKLHVGETGFAFLLDNHGKVIVHPHADLARKQVDFSGHPAFLGTSGPSSKFVSYVRDGVRRIAYSQRTADGWDVVVQQNYAEAYAPVRTADRTALLLLVVTLVLATALAYGLSNRLSRPIVQLTQVAEEMSRGQLGVNIPGTKRSDEIGAMARAIERMGISIQVAINKLRRKPR